MATPDDLLSQAIAIRSSARTLGEMCDALADAIAALRDAERPAAPAEATDGALRAEVETHGDLGVE